jgi:cell division protein FtsI (penicillin-binding protein 3)
MDSKFLKIAIIVFYLLCIGFLVRWQFIGHDYFVAKADTLGVVTDEKTGLRGKIQLLDGTVLAYTETRYDMYIYKPNLYSYIEKIGIVDSRDQDEFISDYIQRLSLNLNIEESKIRELFESSVQNIKIAESLTESQKQSLLDIKISEDLPIFGLDFLPTQKRIYPEKNFLSNVIGFIGRNEYSDSTAINGLESYYNGELSPTTGYKKIEVDANNNEILTADNSKVEYRDGEDIVLTINKTLQKIVEEKLAKGVSDYQAEFGQVVIMNPKDGDILAMAQYPSFDPNNYSQVSDGKFLQTIPISFTYEPGSVGKAFTVAAGVELNGVTPDTMITKSHNGCIMLETRLCRDGLTAQKDITLRKLLEISDNIASFELAEAIGQEGLVQYLGYFGMEKLTGIDISGESIGYNNWRDKMNRIELANNSFGQGYTATAMELVTAYAAFANGGQKIKPRIVSAIKDVDGKEIPISSRSLGDIIKPITAATVTDMLETTLQKTVMWYHPSISKNLISKYKLAGKTGTANIAEYGVYTSQTNLTFIGYDSSPEARFVMLVHLNKPKVLSSSSAQTVLKIWLDIFAESKEILGVTETN